MLQANTRAAHAGLRPMRPPAVEADPDAELVRSLLLVAKQIRALLNLKLAEFDLTAGQDQLLLALGPDATFSVSELAEALTVRASTVSKMVDRLAERGFVARLHDPDDARRIRVRLSPAGIDMQASVRVVLAELETEILRGLGDKADQARTGTEELERTLAARLRRLR